MSWTISVIIILFSLSVIPVFAEDYIITLQNVNPDNSRTYLWQDSPTRVHDGSQWRNYVWSETGQYIRFESRGISFDFYKDSCSFKLFDGGLIGSKKPSVDSYSHSLSVDGKSFSLPSCSVGTVTTDVNGIHFTANRDLFSTVYDLHYIEGLEWTHEIDNSRGKQIDIKITDSCFNCVAKRIQGNMIEFDDYILDTKNDTHGTVSKAAMMDGSFVIDYTGIVLDQEKLIIDPTFSSSSGTRYAAWLNGLGGAACSTIGDSISKSPGSESTPRLQQTTGGTAPSCSAAVYETDISTIPNDSFIDDVDFELTTDAVTNGRACAYTHIDHQPSAYADTAANALQLWDDIHNGTEYINTPGTDACISITTISYDLGSSGDADVKSRVSSGDGWFAIGQHFINEVRDGSTHQTRATSWTLTIQYTLYDPPSFTVTPDITNAGDVFRIAGSIDIIEGVPSANITGIVTRVNGTAINTNSTIHNGTAPYSVNYGPFWVQATDDDVRNITTTATVQGVLTTVTNETKQYVNREYGPNYFTADVPTQGDVNYTFIDNTFKVNRDLGTTFQIECFVQDWTNTFFGTGEGTWYNDTSVGYFSQDLPRTSDYYATCYNDDLLFAAAPLYSNFTNMISPALFIFDALGGFIGMPSVLLFILAIFSWGTGRNFPVVLVIGTAALGVLGAMGLFAMSGELWGLVFVFAGIGVFGIRKFF